MIGNILPRVTPQCSCGAGLGQHSIHAAGCTLGPLLAKAPRQARCTCAADWTTGPFNMPVVHQPGCEYLGRIKPAEPDEGDSLVLVGKRPSKSRPRKTTPVPDYKLVLQFYFTRAVDIDCWKRIRAPKGWRKCPTDEKKQQTFKGVRFQCTDLKYALTPDEMQALHAKLLLSLKLT